MSLFFETLLNENPQLMAFLTLPYASRDKRSVSLEMTDISSSISSLVTFISTLSV